MYRFLLTPRWLGFAALAVVLAAAMTGLGFWQLSRYHDRASVNARIDAASDTPAVPVNQVLGLGAPPDSVAWTRVTMTGRYDPAHQIVARERTHNGTVGFEILDPLVLSDGTAVLVDRGWLPPATGTVDTPSAIPPVPTGTVTVIGRVHLPESRPSRPTVDGASLRVRRISPALLSGHLPYRLLGGYVLADEQRPVANDPRFGAIPVDHQNSTMNAGYVVQWWIFALMVLGAFGWAARREAHDPDDRDFDLAVLHSSELPEAPVSPSV